MATRVAVGKLPYGVGRWSAGWYAVVALFLAGLGLGVFAYARQLIEGEVVTGLRNVGTMGGATWGLYVAFIVYFVGVSFAGITIAALIRLFNLENLRPISRMAELLTVIALILGGLSVIVDVGQPLRALINLPMYGRPMSPFFGTFTLVISGYLFASLVYLYLAGRRDAAILAERTEGGFQKFYRIWAAGYRDTPAERERHRRTSFWLAIAIVPLLVTAHSTLGFVFGLHVGRPGWFSALQAPGFVILAGVSGVGHIIVIAAILRKVLGVESQLTLDVFKWLRNFLLVLTAAYLYFMVVEWLTTTYTGHHHEVKVSMALLYGEYLWLFWGVVASMAIALGILLLSYFPVPTAVEQPAFQPAIVRLVGATVVAVLVLTLVQGLPGFQQPALTVSPTASALLPWLLALAFGVLAAMLVPRLMGNVIGAAVLSGILVNIAAIFKRVLVVVPSQTHGTLLPYGPGSYSPSWVEYSVILGLMAFGALLYTLFMKVFPIMEIAERAAGGS